MTSPQTTVYLSKLFEEHGITCVVENDWIVPNSELPALRALWYPGESNGRLDVQALINEEKLVIEECFAGIGTGDSALHDALTNFTINSFHVLLAGLWKHNDPDQVATENWEVCGKRYTAYVGNFGTRGSVGVTAQIPDELFAKIEETIRLENLNEDIHWFRFYFGNVGVDRTFEALKDNEIWEAGIDCLQSIPWTPSAGFYSVRLFIILRAV